MFAFGGLGDDWGIVVLVELVDVAVEVVVEM